MLVDKALSHKRKRIGKSRSKKFRTEYLIKWLGLDDTYNTWEPTVTVDTVTVVYGIFECVMPPVDCHGRGTFISFIDDS